MKKIIYIIILILVLIYVLYVLVDSVRLRNSPTDTKPFITLKAVENENKYIGLGYSVRYYVDRIEDSDGVLVLGYGAEFKLFDKILVWAWAE